MEGFDTNPFDDANPFADSSVRQARKVNNEETKPELDNYNPFANDQFTPQVTQPAVIQPSETRSSTTIPPTYNVAVATSNLTRQQEELDRRAAELDRRERDINTRAVTVVSGGSLNNFPPFPSCCPCKPCFIQDINIDIPQPYQLIVRIHFYIWIAFTILMFLNVIGSLASLIVLYSSSSGTTFGLSIFYFIILPPLSYIFWFRAIYNALKKDSSMNYFLYFIIFFLHNCINIFWCIGIPSSGAVGFISGLATIPSHAGVGVFMVIIGVFFGVIGGLGIILILRVLHYYRHTDASFRKAQEELASGVLTNRGVQQAAASAASSALNDESHYNRY